MQDPERLIKRTIDAAMAVHIELGPGFIESVYENALAMELTERGLSVATQVPVEVLYHGRVAGHHRLDMLVEGTVIVENKAVRDLDPVFFVIVRSYMRAMRLTHALILNFAKERLEIKRVFPNR